MKAFFAIFAIFMMIFVSVQAADKAVCSLPKVVGPCRKSDNSFYYNSEAKECQAFIYGGCQGNENRFDSKDACEKLCL